MKEGRLIEIPDPQKDKALEFLAHIIEAVPDLAGNPELTEAILAREHSQNTGIGLGVACPHVRTVGNGELICAVGWSPVGIDYEALDGKKVHLVVMYMIPELQKNIYLKEVSMLASAIQKQGGIQSIATAEDIATVREQLLDWVSAAIETNIPETKARMIRLEARQAAAEVVPIIPSAQALVQVVPVMILALAENQRIILSQNAELTAMLEKMENLEALIQQHGQFESNGYRIIFRTATNYEPNRTLYEYLAIKFA